MRPLIDLAYRVQKQLWRLLRPKTRGVKVMLFNGAGELLLIRNNYGDIDLFVLPGGGIRPWERPEQAAIREVNEELSCSIEQLQPVSTHFSGSEGSATPSTCSAPASSAIPGPTISKSPRRASSSSAPCHTTSRRRPAAGSRN